MRIKAREIMRGNARGEALVSPEPISFYGGIDPDTGRIIESGHPLEGQSVSKKILVFPTGKGSTVGSYVLYRLKKNGLAPAGIINRESETIVAVGAIISQIPMVDQLEKDPLKTIKTGDTVEINNGVVEVG